MDRDLKAIERAPVSSWSRVCLAGALATLVMLASSLFILSCPTDAYRAGYDAAVTGGRAWVDAVGASDGAALRVCEALQLKHADALTGEYGEFVAGCGAGVDHVYGRHIPLLADVG